MVVGVAGGVGAALGAAVLRRRRRSAGGVPDGVPAATARFAAGVAFGVLVIDDLARVVGSLLVVAAGSGLAGGLVLWLVIGAGARLTARVTTAGAPRWPWLPGPAWVFGGGVGLALMTQLNAEETPATVRAIDTAIYETELVAAIVLIVLGLCPRPARRPRSRPRAAARLVGLLVLGGLVIGFTARSTVRGLSRVIPGPELVPVATAVAAVLVVLAGLAIMRQLLDVVAPGPRAG